jgi:hypothetical protein
VAAVMIGVDPHKGSHTAVVIDQHEVVLGQVRVRASAVQAKRLMAWAAAWPERTWAVEGARGMGYLLDWQLVAAGERVLDVQPKLGARVRLLATGKTNKNDPNDALSVAIAALRSAATAQVRPDDHATVLKVWSPCCLGVRSRSRAGTRIAARPARLNVMRFLVDANLSPRVATTLSSEGFKSVHVGDVGLLTAADQAILDCAAANELVRLRLSASCWPSREGQFARRPSCSGSGSPHPRTAGRLAGSESACGGRRA